MPTKVDVELKINGKVYRGTIEPRLLLSDFIRHVASLKGTHVGCEHGVCGACTVMIDGRTARSCLHFAVAVQDCEITTVESLAGEGDLHPIQEAFHEAHGLQCGYCTPGFMLTAMEFLRAHPNPTRAQIKAALTNNVCRCTGYTNIVKAVELAAKKLAQRQAAE